MEPLRYAPAARAPAPAPRDDPLQDLSRRVELQNRLAELCKRQCLDIGAYPFCTECPPKVNPMPAPLSWNELFARMQRLKSWGRPRLEISHLDDLEPDFLQTRQERGASCEVAQTRRSQLLREALLQTCTARELPCTSVHQASHWEGLLQAAQHLLAPRGP